MNASDNTKITKISSQEISSDKVGNYQKIKSL